MKCHPKNTQGKRWRFAFAAILIVMAFLFLAPARAADASQQNQRLGRGVNTIGWDDLWKDRARGNFKDVHFKLIREAGFNHVRINLHPLRDGQPDTNGKLRKELFQTLDWGRGWSPDQPVDGNSGLPRRPSYFS